MTLPAVDTDNVRGVDGVAYKVGPHCANPNCSKFADDSHHIVRRSALRKQPKDWVAIDGHVVGNLTGLCADCHRDVTGQNGHKAWILWNPVDLLFWWCLLGPLNELGKPTPLPVAPLRYQPPTPETLASRADDTSTGPDACPFCGQTRRRRSTPGVVGRRRRKSWTVTVPADDIEQGADVLDSLIDALAPLVPNADSSTTGRYYVLVPALAFALISSQEFVASFEGVNAA